MEAPRPGLPRAPLQGARPFAALIAGGGEPSRALSAGICQFMWVMAIGYGSFVWECTRHAPCVAGFLPGRRMHTWALHQPSGSCRARAVHSNNCQALAMCVQEGVQRCPDRICPAVLVSVHPPMGHQAAGDRVQPIPQPVPGVGPPHQGRPRRQSHLGLPGPRRTCSQQGGGEGTGKGAPGAPGARAGHGAPGPCSAQDGCAWRVCRAALEETGQK